MIAGLGTAAGLMLARSARAETSPLVDEPMSPAEPGRDFAPVFAPNLTKLPFRVVQGVKVFHLIAEEFDHEFAPGLIAKCWGYNGSTPGPVIEVAQGDRVRIYVTNRLPAATSVHWHGLILPNGMDGVSGLNQPVIPPGKTFRYEFLVRQHGTFMYHSHHDEMIQQALGLQGMFISHPRGPAAVDRDFALLMSTWFIDAGTRRPDPLKMNDFNVLTFNGKCYPATHPLVARTGERIRIRMGNLSPMDHHGIHLHGYHWLVTETDGGVIPEAGRWPETTVLVATGSTRTVEFRADHPGDWAMHCHMTHHAMNQMGHDVVNLVGIDPSGLDQRIERLVPGYMTMGHNGMGDMHVMNMPVPSNSIPMVGAPGPFGYINMGGMFTILKVRDDAKGYDDPGWYHHPEGTVAREASEAERAADGI
jgi:FtsP/CotA-like multicopper oxidase with cupredoxin domain